MWTTWGWLGKGIVITFKITMHCDYCKARCYGSQQSDKSQAMTLRHSGSRQVFKQDPKLAFGNLKGY